MGRTSGTPGAVPHTSTYALTNVTLPYIEAIATNGLVRACRADSALALGVNAMDGTLTSATVARAHAMTHTPVPEDFLSLTGPFDDPNLVSWPAGGARLAAEPGGGAQQDHPMAGFEAQQRADDLRAELSRRDVHPDVLRFCRAELLDQNYFHAVLEASKSVADKLRGLTRTSGDGSPLVDATCSLASGPRIAFNSLATEWERSEQTGIATLMKGLFSTFRNPAAHAHAAGQPGPTSTLVPHRRLRRKLRPVGAGGVLGLSAETGCGASGLVMNCPAGQNIGTAGQAGGRWTAGRLGQAIRGRRGQPSRPRELR
jgi:uncharacterized protein (TIGR02391 family)